MMREWKLIFSVLKVERGKGYRQRAPDARYQDLDQAQSGV